MQLKKKTMVLIMVGMFFAGAVVMGGVCAGIMKAPGSTSSNDEKLTQIKNCIDAYYLNDYE